MHLAHKYIGSGPCAEGKKNKRQQTMTRGDKALAGKACARIIVIARTGFRVRMEMRSDSHVTPSRSLPEFILNKFATGTGRKQALTALFRSLENPKFGCTADT